jgi:hypothetical protein
VSYFFRGENEVLQELILPGCLAIPSCACGRRLLTRPDLFTGAASQTPAFTQPVRFWRDIVVPLEWAGLWPYSAVAHAAPLLDRHFATQRCWVNNQLQQITFRFNLYEPLYPSNTEGMGTI